MTRYRLSVEEVPEAETKEEIISVAITMDPVAIFRALEEGDKGRLLFRLLAAVLHDESDSLEFYKEEYIEAAKATVKEIRNIYHGRWTDYTCGLSADDAETLGFDVTCLREQEQKEKEAKSKS